MIIQRYIHYEIFYRWIWITILLTLIFTTNKFVDYLADAAAGKIPADYVMSLLWHRMLSLQTELMPLLLFLATILAFARLNQDNELAVLGAAGLGKNYQIRVSLKFCFVYSILLAYVAFIAAPWAKRELDDLKIQAWKDASISALTSGKFKELEDGDSVVYVEQLTDNDTLMKNVFLQMTDAGNDSVLHSKSAYLNYDQSSGGRFIIFEDGDRYEGQPGTSNYRITDYSRYGILLETRTGQRGGYSLESMSTPELLATDTPQAKAQLQWRISSILVCIVLSFLAVLLNQYPFGQKPFALVLIGILIYFIYNNLLSISSNLVIREKIPAYIGLWWVHLISIAAIYYVYRTVSFVETQKSSDEVEILTRDQ